MNQNTENMSLEEALVYIKALKDENEKLKRIRQIMKCPINSTNSIDRIRESNQKFRELQEAPLIQLPGTDDLIDICNTNSMWFSDDFMYTNYLIINCKKDIA